MWLPEKFHELLPYLYVIGGIITTIFADSLIGYASGYLLFLTGGIVLLMRMHYREGKRNKKH